MYIYKETVVEDTPVSRHSVGHVEIRGDYVTLGVHSYEPAPASEAGSPTGGASFYRTFAMPMSDFNAGPYPDNCYNWLIAQGSKLQGGSIVPDDAMPLDVQKAQLLAEVRELRDQFVHGGYAAPSIGVFDTDEVSIRNILGTAQMATLSNLQAQPFSVDWRLQDNSVQTFDANGFINIAAGVMEHIKGCYTNSWDLKAQIEAADETTIGSIDVNTGWPL